MVPAIEPELQADAPRQVRMTSEGGRRLLLSTMLVATTLSAATIVFVSRQQPPWREAIFALAFLLGLASLYLAISRWLARVRLVESGIPVSAKIVAKEQWGARLAHYYCWYEAAGQSYGLGWAGPAGDAGLGDPVTVLYCADEPAQAVAYRWAGCEVDLARAGLVVVEAV